VRESRQNLNILRVILVEKNFRILAIIRNLGKFQNTKKLINTLSGCSELHLNSRILRFGRIAHYLG
jgi:hypothetical protein